MPHSSSSNTRGIALMCLAMALFTANDVLVKLATEQMPVGQTVVLRSLCFVPVVSVLITWRGYWGLVPRLAHPRILIRSVLEGLVAFIFITVLANMGIAEATAIFLTGPLMMTALSALTGDEQVGWRRWLAVLVGFVGMLIVVRPSPAGVNIFAALALLSACGSTVRDFITRKIDPAIPSILVAFLAGIAAGLTGVVFSLGETWRMPSPAGWSYLFGSAILVAAGTSAIITAFRSAEVSLISPFRYTIMLWATIAGVLIWRELPDAPALIGTGIIVASGLYILHRERVRARDARSAKTEEPLTTASHPSV